MKVFISWSGETSRQLGEALRDWLPSVIQAVKPYFSPKDIEKGTRWAGEISKELEESEVGLLCLTPDNFNADWILFEAGALSKRLEESRVCPILFDIETSNITGPLATLNMTNFGKEEIKQTLQMINKSLDDNALRTEVLNDVFDKWWPDLECKVNNILKKSQRLTEKPASRSEKEILAEILDRVRSMQYNPNIESSTLNSLNSEELRFHIETLISCVIQDENTGTESMRALQKIISLFPDDFLNKNDYVSLSRRIKLISKDLGSIKKRKSYGMLIDAIGPNTS